MENMILTDEPVTIEKFYICPIFELKEEIKLNGARWDSDAKSWYVTNRDDKLYEMYKKKYLLNKYENIDIYRENNARWSSTEKYWYTYNTNEELKEYFTENK